MTDVNALLASRAQSEPQSSRGNGSLPRRPQVLILGGCGRIGAAAALDILHHTNADVCLTSRSPSFPDLLLGERSERLSLQALDFADATAFPKLLSDCSGLDQPHYDLVVHCAGPFRQRDLSVLTACIEAGVNYLDVSDSPDYVRSTFDLRSAAQQAEVTAIVSGGVFPGLSNSMARLAAEQFEQLEQLQLNYVVAGSGGAGPTVMRTTFLELQTPFPAWRQGRWQQVQPYSDRQVVEFPPPYGSASVYWFNTSEAATLPDSFACNQVVTKFGSLPQFYNQLTAAMTWGPLGWLLQKPAIVEGLAQISYAMTQVSDRFSGVGLAMQAVATGHPKPGLVAEGVGGLGSNAELATYQVDFTHDNTALAAGQGVGSIAADLLAGRLCKPGVWPVEQAVPMPLFLAALEARGLALTQCWQGGCRVP